MLIKTVRVGESARAQNTFIAMKIATAGLTCYLVVLLSFINLPLHGQEANQLPKGAKQEAVLYKNADMVGMGYRYKEQFVENQKVEFFKLYKASEYKLKKKKGKYHVVGRGKTQPVTSLEPLLQGTYFTANGMAYVEGEWHPGEKSMYQGTFLISNAGNDIRPVDIQGFYIETNKATLSGDCLGNMMNYQLEIKFTGKNIRRLKCEFPKDVLIKKMREKSHNFYANQQIGWEIIYDCLLHIEQKEIPVNILFKNLNQFHGNIRLGSRDDVIPNKGICKYFTGETFDGIYEDIFWDSQNGTLHIPTQGTMTFTDGTTATGNWLEADNFTKEDWESIYTQGDSPTAIHNKVLRKQRELAEVKRRQALEEQRKKQEELRKKQEELRKKQEQERREMLRRQQLIAKYGRHYGPLIEKGELELGMTTAMVNEIWSQDFFDRSEAIEYGQRIELWTFNESKMNMAIAKKEDGETELLAMLFIDGVGEMFGISGITKKDIPYQLVFTNRRLTKIIR